MLPRLAIQFLVAKGAQLCCSSAKFVHGLLLEVHVRLIRFQDVDQAAVICEDTKTVAREQKIPEVVPHLDDYGLLQLSFCKGSAHNLKRLVILI
jgi:hypothetical protein